MQKDTLVNQLSKTPMISRRQEILVKCSPDYEHGIPECEINFVVTIDDKDITLVEHALVTISDRKSAPLKEYPIIDTGIFIYYSGSKTDGNDKIVSILIQKEDDVGENGEGGHTELLTFLELCKDAEAIQAYRSLAFYWTAIQSGVNLINGDFEMPIDDSNDTGF